VVRSDGTVADARVLRISLLDAAPDTEQALKDAVQKSAVDGWRFSPAKKDGVAVPVWFMVTVDYDRQR